MLPPCGYLSIRTFVTCLCRNRRRKASKPVEEEHYVIFQQSAKKLTKIPCQLTDTIAQVWSTYLLLAKDKETLIDVCAAHVKVVAKFREIEGLDASVEVRYAAFVVISSLAP